MFQNTSTVMIQYLYNEYVSSDNFFAIVMMMMMCYC